MTFPFLYSFLSIQEARNRCRCFYGLNKKAWGSSSADIWSSWQPNEAWCALSAGNTSSWQPNEAWCGPSADNKSSWQPTEAWCGPLLVIRAFNLRGIARVGKVIWKGGLHQL